MSHELDVEGFGRELARRDRLLVLYHAGWCPFSRLFLPVFEGAEGESSVPFARVDLRHPLDPRWDDMEIRVVPTLVYYESGEPLERLDGLRRVGITKRDFEEFLEHVEAIQAEPYIPKKHQPRRGRPGERS